MARQWSLTLEPHFAAIDINYLAPAARADGTRCVLKLSRHVDETRNEIAALQIWNGEGAARLLEAEPDAGALLLERLEPGTMLSTVVETNDDGATLIACDVLRQLWRPAPAQDSAGAARSGSARLSFDGLRPLVSWCAAFDRNRAVLSQGADGFPAQLFLRADALRRELLMSTDREVVLHGDLHHFNVLRAQRADWLAIDPKGLAGDRCFDVCQFFKNPKPVPLEINRRRLDIFCAELGLDRQRTKDWSLVHAVLDACWDFEGGASWHDKVAYAQEMLSL
jgi:streptomycin 6-kinase